MYNPSHNLSFAGDEVYLKSDDENPTTLTQHQADQINREYSEHCLAVCDTFKEPPIQSAFYEGIIAELDTTSFNIFAENIGQNAYQLSLELGWESIIVISNTRVPYLQQKTPYEPVKEAINTLIDMGMSKSSTDALRLGPRTIASFFRVIFWIIRCNAAAPEISFSSKNSNIIGTLCKYGNIHFDCYNEAEAGLLRQALKAANFIVVADKICTEKFSDATAIEGRKLDLER